MDIRCPKCGEPWENDCLHEEAEARGHTCGDLKLEGNPCTWRGCAFYGKLQKEFRAKGCAVFTTYGGKCNEDRVGSSEAHLTSALMDMMGDDFDGLAYSLEDAEMMGLL